MKEIDVLYAEKNSAWGISRSRPSIFLAGPTPRSPKIPSWRPLALYHLSEMGFDGQIFVPETPSGGIGLDYTEQIYWEAEGLRTAHCIMFWIPRDIDTMPGFTTNIEFGMWYKSGKVVLGYPECAHKMGYIEHYAKEVDIPRAGDLRTTVILAMEKAKKNV